MNVNSVHNKLYSSGGKRSSSEWGLQMKRITQSRTGWSGYPRPTNRKAWEHYDVTDILARAWER